MAQKNRANMLTDIVSNIYNNLINFITGQNAQDRFVNLLDSSPNILSDKDQADGYVGLGPTLEIFSSYYDEEISRADLITDLTANLAVGGKFYRINDAVGATITLLVIAESNLNLYPFGIDATTGEIGTYDITTDVFTPIVSSAQTLSQTLVLGNTSGSNDIEFDTTQGLLFANTSRLREGTIDAGLGGLKGIAQICGAGYELKWENGRLYVMGSSGNTIRQSLYNFTTTPTVTDDSTKGYAVGSLWTLDDGTVYVCSDATLGAAVWAIGGIPDLQQVTTVGATTSNGITVDNGAGESITIKHNTIDITNTLGGVASITSTILNTPIVFNLPDKPTNDTFAMLSDITGGGLDLEVNGTPNGDQTLLNLVAGTNITLTDDGIGSVTIDASGGGGGDVYLANDQTFTGENTFTIGSGSDTPITINKGGSGAALTVNKTSGSGDAIEVANGSVSIADETASTIAHFDGSKRLKSLATSTYPSLTELALVKGVTGSDIQTQIDGKLNLTGGSLTGAINEAKGTDIASAATTDIGAATGNYVVVTGTTTITALGTVQAGTRRIVNFSGILTLTHNGTSLILPTSANITTAAGDTATFVSLGSGNWVCTNYMRASGAALVGSLKDTILVSVMGTTIVSPLDSTSYHFGIQPWTPNTTAAFRAFKFTDAGTIEKFSFALSQTINGSNQTVTIYLRNVTTSTDNLIGTFTSDFGANTTLKTLITSLSIAVNTTDDWTLKILTPAWGTNPSDWVFGGTLSLTKS